MLQAQELQHKLQAALGEAAGAKASQDVLQTRCSSAQQSLEVRRPGSQHLARQLYARQSDSVPCHLCYA